MNRIYRVIWSKVRGTWIVASELATGRSKSTSNSGATRPIAGGRWLLPQISPLRIAVLAALLGLHAPAQAADRYWDINRTLPGLGGAGTWDLSTTFWGADDDGVAGPSTAWSNAALDDAYLYAARWTTRAETSRSIVGFGPREERSASPTVAPRW